MHEHSELSLLVSFGLVPVPFGAFVLWMTVRNAIAHAREFSVSDWMFQVAWAGLIGLGLMVIFPLIGWQEFQRRRSQRTKDDSGGPVSNRENRCNVPECLASGLLNLARGNQTMSPLDDPFAEVRVNRLRETAAFVPFFATIVIVVGVCTLVGVGWFVLGKWTLFIAQADKSHLQAVKMGMLVGVILGGGTVVGLTSVVYGFWLLFRRKNDLLLVSLWDELVEGKSDGESD